MKENFRVRPLPAPALSPQELAEISKECKPAVGCWGFLLCLILVGLAYSLETIFGFDQWPMALQLAVMVLNWGFAILILYLITRQIRVSRYREKVAQREKEELLKRTKEAANLTSRALEELETIRSSLDSIPSLLLSAKNDLNRAEREFEARAFGPFWDAVEESARKLDTYYRLVSQLSNAVTAYYRLLHGYEHTFPSLQVHGKDAPSHVPTIVRNLETIVKNAQRDFEFATIWEHRQTRKVLIAGFESLGEALYHIGDVLENSIGEFEQSLHSNIAKTVEQQIRSRDQAEIANAQQISLLKEIRDK